MDTIKIINTTNFNKDPHWYCANIHAGLALKIDFKGNLQVAPCVVFGRPPTFDKSPNIDQSVFNIPFLEKLRQHHKQTKKLSGPCQQCDPLLSNGIAVVNANRSSANLIYVKDQLLYDQPGPKLLSLQISTVCNLACTTCGPELSSKWRSLEGKYSRVVSSLKEDKIRSVLRNINFQNLETVHIWGGEPFLDSIHEVVLEELIRYGKNITVWYDSNATHPPSSRTIQLWKMFKLVKIKFSIDGIGESFEYLRWPAKWKSVEENILSMVQQLPSNVMFGLRPAIGFLNLHLIKSIRDWYEKTIPTNREGDPTEFEYNGVYGVFSGNFITPEFKKELGQIYDSSDPVYKVMPRIINANPQNLINIKLELAKIDTLRGTDFKTSLPHIVKYLS